MRTRLPSRFARLVPGFCNHQKGVAAVEFALIAPMLLVLYLGATDLTQALAIDRKLTQVSATVSDLISQRTGITRAQVHDYFRVGSTIMQPFDFERLRLRLTIVEVGSDVARVTGATARNWTIEAANGQNFALPDDMIDLAEGRYAVIASAGYEYTPLFFTVFNASIGLEKQSIHVARRDVSNFQFAMTPEDQEMVENGG